MFSHLINVYRVPNEQRILFTFTVLSSAVRKSREAHIYIKYHPCQQHKGKIKIKYWYCLFCLA